MLNLVRGLPAIRLSRSERIIAAVLAVLLLANLYLLWDIRQTAAESQSLRQQEEKGRRALQTARSQADLPALEQEKLSLSAALATSLPSRTEESRITLKLWEWATESGVELRQVERSSGALTLAGSEFAALKFNMRATGEPPVLQRFMGLISSSRYIPQAEELTLKPVEGGQDRWELTLTLITPVRQR